MFVRLHSVLLCLLDCILCCYALVAVISARLFIVNSNIIRKNKRCVLDQSKPAKMVPHFPLLSPSGITLALPNTTGRSDINDNFQPSDNSSLLSKRNIDEQPNQVRTITFGSISEFCLF